MEGRREKRIQEEEDELEEKIRKKKRRDKIIDIVLSILFLPYVCEGLIIDDYVSIFSQPCHFWQ